MCAYGPSAGLVIRGMTCAKCGFCGDDLRLIVQAMSASLNKGRVTLFVAFCVELIAGQVAALALGCFGKRNN